MDANAHKKEKMSIPEYFQAIENHLDQYFDSTDEIVVFDEKVSPDFHLDVYWIKPNKNRDYHILLTNGVSHKPMTGSNEKSPKYIELVILLPNQWNLKNWKIKKNYWPIELLKNIGRYPHENKTWLGFGHTIPQPKNKPIIGTSYFSTILLKSKTLPQDFQNITFGNERIDIYTLFPLFESEQKYKTKYGTNALLEKFDESKINDIINTNRVNVI